jgi:hypothetical protein
MDFNPRNLKGELVKIYEHSMVFLNASKKYQNSETPKNYQDWIDLFYASMKEPVNYKLNLNNKGVAKVIDIINFDKLDGETLQKMKEDEGKKVMEILIKKEGANKEKIDIAIEMIKDGESDLKITKYTKLSKQEIDILRNRLNNK